MAIRKAALALLCAALLAALPGCAVRPSAPPPEGETEETITFTDDLGRTVSLPRPARVAALIGSFADIWCLAGGQDTLVAAADDAWTQFALDLPDSVANLGAVKSPSLEALLAAQPDFVIGSTKTAADVKLLDTLDGLGIPAACFDVSSFDDYLRMLDICTRLTGCTDAYTQYGSGIQAQIDAAVARADGSAPRVLYIHRLQLQGQKQPRHRAGGNAGRPWLRQHRRQRDGAARDPQSGNHRRRGP